MADDAYRKPVKRKSATAFEAQPSVIVRSFEVAPDVYAEGVVLVSPDGSPLALDSAPADWRPAAATVIQQANAYQVLFPAGAARRGGYVVNTSSPDMGPLWVDPTGATGGARSKGAVPLYPAPDSGAQPPGWQLPPTSGAVTIMGPAGATFQAFAA